MAKSVYFLTIRNREIIQPFNHSIAADDNFVLKFVPIFSVAFISFIIIIIHQIKPYECVLY